MFEIIKNAPPPSVKGKRHTYLFANMEVDDAFDAPRDMGKNKDGGDKRQISILACARFYKKTSGSSAKFTTRILDADTVRCHRIA